MLTKSEKEIMQLLWSVDKPLSSTEIVNMSVDRTWKKSYIHLLVNSLLNKNVIKVSGFVKSTKNYARTFEPVMSEEEYKASQITGDADFTDDNIPALLTALISNVKSVEVLDSLAKIIEDKKSEITE